MILKHYANLDCGQTHYRRGGSGQPVILLHPSPMSSEFLLPIIQSLVESNDVIAPDTAGYGRSDPLPDEWLQQHSDLQPYVDWLDLFLQELDLQDVVIYGSATGAQIAIEYAKQAPTRVKHLVLDNAAHFSAEEVADFAKDYFPSLAPQADGEHMDLAWGIAESIFQWFPWYAKDEAHRVGEQTMPAEFVHATAMAYLNAGTNYAEAYRRAFSNERAERLMEVPVPVSIVRWAGSIIKPYVDRFDQFELPEHINMLRLPDGQQERLAGLTEFIASL